MSQKSDTTIEVLADLTKYPFRPEYESDYRNSCQLKRSRAEKHEQTASTCELCGEKAVLVHHKDFSKSNHALTNLLTLCDRCHRKIHSVRYQKEKPLRKKLKLQLIGSIRFAAIRRNFLKTSQKKCWQIILRADIITVMVNTRFQSNEKQINEPQVRPLVFTDILWVACGSILKRKMFLPPTRSPGDEAPTIILAAILK